jgi:hypothetical protein
VRGLKLAGALWLLAMPSALAAQASAYVPLDDIAYTYVDA